jgi:hypothetical protein
MNILQNLNDNTPPSTSSGINNNEAYQSANSDDYQTLNSPLLKHSNSIDDG